MRRADLTRREALAAVGLLAVALASGCAAIGIGDAEAEVVRRRGAVSAFSAEGLGSAGEATEEAAAVAADSPDPPEDAVRRYHDGPRPFAEGDYEARATVVCSMDELRSLGDYELERYDPWSGALVTVPNPGYSGYDNAFFEGHDLLVGQAPHGSISQAGFELAGACVQDGVAVMYARRLPDPWDLGTLDAMDKEVFRAELPKAAGGYAGARIALVEQVVSPGDGGAVRLAFSDRGAPCAGMRLEGALVDAGSEVGPWPDDPAGSFSCVLGASGAAVVRGMRAGETWRVRGLAWGGRKVSGAVAVAPYGFGPAGDVVFSTA